MYDGGMMNRAKLSLRLILTIVFGGMLLLMAALLSVTVENLAARQMHRVASESLATLAQRMIQGLEQEPTAADIAQFARTSENLQLQEPETQIDLFIISRDGHLLLAPEALDDIQLPVLEQGDALPVAGSTASIIKWADGRNYMTVWVPGQFQDETANASWYGASTG